MSKSSVNSTPAFRPTHPGELLRVDVLPGLNLKRGQTAELLDISRQTISAILNERQAVTPEMSAKLGALIGNGPDFWLRMQQKYDLWHIQQEIGSRLRRIEAAGAVLRSHL
jgi:addiction module HigA family antidote